MPKDMCVSPSIFQLKIEWLFQGEWICVWRSDEIPNISDDMSFALCKQPLSLVRGKDDDIQAMSNVCRHLMMRLVDGIPNKKNSPDPIMHGQMISVAILSPPPK